MVRNNYLCLEFESGRVFFVRAWDSRGITRLSGPTKCTFQRRFSRIQKKKKNLRPWFCQAATNSQIIKYLGVFISILYIHKFAFIFVAFSASMSGTSLARLERKHEWEGPNNYRTKTPPFII